MTGVRHGEEARIAAILGNRAAALRAKDAVGVVSHQNDDFVLFSLAPPPVSDAVAFCHSLNRRSGTMTGGTRNDLRFRQTLGLRRVDDRWTIVHQHESVPFYMDGSDRAAVDRAP